MEVEKSAAGGVMSYQGGAAAASVEAAAVPDFMLGAADQKRATEEKPISDKQLKNAVNDLNKHLNQSEAIFEIHEKTNRVTIKIVDKATKEVLKEYPPEQMLDMIAKVWETAGILVDEKG